MKIGLVGGIIALIGAVIPWMFVQTCAGAMGMNFCVSVPIPGGLGGINPILGFAPLVALLTALLGTVFVCLQKPQTGLVAGVMGILSFVFALLFVVSFGGVQQQIMSMVAGGGSASVSIGISFGVYLTIIGGLILGAGGFLQWSKLKVSSAAPSAVPTA